MTLLLTLWACKGGSEDESVEELLDGLVAIYLSPDATIVPIGQTLQMQAQGVYEDRTTSDLTAVVDWKSSSPDVAKISNEFDEEGELTAKGTGKVKISAVLGDFASTDASIEVTEADLLGLSIEPGELSLSKNQEVQLKAWAAYTGGGRADATGYVRWIVDDGSVATVSNGLVTAKATGSTTLRASLDGLDSPDVPVDVGGGGGGGTSGSGADLVISQVTAETSGTTLVLDVTVKNQGSGSASGFYTDVWIDPPASIDSYGDGYVFIDYLGPGSSESYAFSFDVGSGKHDVYVYADTEGSVAESDESNNDFYGSVSTSGGTGTGSGPNLEITYFDWISDSSAVYWYVDVTNTGAASVGSFYVDLYVDEAYEPALYQDGDTYTTVESLSAGGTTYADFLIETTYCAYGCTSWAQIDSYDDVSETDESDNVAGPLYVYQ